MRPARHFAALAWGLALLWAPPASAQYGAEADPATCIDDADNDVTDWNLPPSQPPMKDCDDTFFCGAWCALCVDGSDPDGDGIADCSDPDCAAHPYCAPGYQPEICDDGIDNDGMGLIDCQDPECSCTAACNGGNLDCSDPYCRADPLCRAPEDCSDALRLDEDDDGLVNCDDEDCCADPYCDPASGGCASDGVPCFTGPICTAEICDDAVDNDGDGLVDCADGHCWERPPCNDPDGDGLPNDIEALLGSDPMDADSDDDGIVDGLEDADGNGAVGPGETDPTIMDSDGDGLQDGTELGYGSGIGCTGAGHPTDTAPALFQEDRDCLTVTDPLHPDSDGDGLCDGDVGEGLAHPSGLCVGGEDRDRNGRVDAGFVSLLETDPGDVDSDDDGVPDSVENPQGGDPSGPSAVTSAVLFDSDWDGLQDGTEQGYGTDPGCLPPHPVDTNPFFFVPDRDCSTLTDPNDSDSDDDGPSDGAEDANANGLTEPDESDPARMDSDGDGLSDGQELGYGTDAACLDPATGTDRSVWIPDGDCNSRTDPVAPDTDGDGLIDGWGNDGGEDVNLDGRFDPAIAVKLVETDPLDHDTDDDGLLDGAEVLGFFVSAYHKPTGAVGRFLVTTHPRVCDSDGDGLMDGTEGGLVERMEPGSERSADWLRPPPIDLDCFVRDADPPEAEQHTNPTDQDTDGDGIPDSSAVLDDLVRVGFCAAAEDLNRDGSVDVDPSTFESLETDPNRPDSDDDRLSDGEECAGPCPPDAADPTDPLSWDTDGDGADDGTECAAGTNPLGDFVEPGPEDEGCACGAARGSGAPAGPLGLFLALGWVRRRSTRGPAE